MVNLSSVSFPQECDKFVQSKSPENIALGKEQNESVKLLLDANHEQCIKPKFACWSIRASWLHCRTFHPASWWETPGDLSTFPLWTRKSDGTSESGFVHKWRNDTTKSVLMISTIIMPETKLLTSCVLVPYTSWDLWVWTVNTIAVCRLQCRERWLARKWLPRFDWSLQWNRISCLRDAQVFHISHKFLHPVWFTEHLKKLQTSW